MVDAITAAVIGIPVYLCVCEVIYFYWKRYNK
jgi:hypothetical protein